jgi:hypothetical protein
MLDVLSDRGLVTRTSPALVWQVAVAHRPGDGPAVS